MTKVTKEDIKAISKGSGVSIALISFLLIMGKLAWNVVSYVTTLENKLDQAISVQEKHVVKIEDLSENDNYIESLIQGVNFRHELHLKEKE